MSTNNRRSSFLESDADSQMSKETYHIDKDVLLDNSPQKVRPKDSSNKKSSENTSPASTQQQPTSPLKLKDKSDKKKKEAS